MKTMKNFLCYATFLIAALIGGSCLTSCNTSDDNPSPAPEVTLEDALTDGNVVAMAFNLNGEDFYVAFVRVGDTYELLDFDRAMTRAEEPVITEKDCEFTMIHDKENNQIKFTVKEKKTSGLVLTAVIDIKQSTMEVTPGDPKYKVTGVKMKVSNVEITNLLKKKGEGVTLTDALVKGAKVEVSYYWERSKTPTVFTFTNEGGTFSCKTTGYNNDTFEKGRLWSEGNLLRFSVINNVNPYCSLEIDFNVPNMTYKFFTVFHDYYDSFKISVNDTDLTSKINKE
jgi:hypothetical protein